MVKNIVKCEKMLILKSLPAVKEDLELQYDLRDTLSFYRQGCVGMAANMIGILKRIIIFINEKEESVVMFNPVILAASGEYEVEEGFVLRIPEGRSGTAKSRWNIGIGNLKKESKPIPALPLRLFSMKSTIVTAY